MRARSCPPGEKCGSQYLFDQPHGHCAKSRVHVSLRPYMEFQLSMETEEARRRAGALFKKEQQSREAEQAMSDYEAQLQAMREKTARLRALRLARDAGNTKKPRGATAKAQRS